jgi:crossover junction endodeoxyribonuclease RuvC
MKRLMGIDPSTHLGMALVAGDQNLGKYVNFPTEKGFDRLHLLAKAVHNTVEEWQPDVVVIEDYAINNKFTRTEMVEVGTVIRNALYYHGLGWYTVIPTSLKKWVIGKGGGKGKEGKDAMAASVNARWGFTSKHDDVIDAFALAKFGETIAINGLDPKLKGVQYHAHSRIQTGGSAHYAG